MALTHLDAGVLIGILDANDAHHGAARHAIFQLARSDQLAMVASAAAECFVSPT